MKNQWLVVGVILILVVLCACLAMDIALGAILVWQAQPAAVPYIPTPAEGVVLVPAPTVTGARPTGTPTPGRPTPAPRTGVEAPVVPTAAVADYSATLRALAEAEIPDRDPYRLAERLKKLPGPIQPTVPDRAREYKVGDQEDFWVSNQVGNEYFRITATLSYITPHVYMWIQEGVPVSSADVQQAAEEFENKIYPTNRELFGSEWQPGIDGDPHLFILHAQGLGPSIGGYYSSTDEYPRTIDQYSNEHEMFYVNVDARRPGAPGYGSLLAHEFQHMIHWNADRSEESWVNEGAAGLAEALNGYDANATVALFGSDPDVQLNTWAEDIVARAAHYGNAFLFGQYFFQRLGAEPLRDLVAESGNGLDGYSRVLERHGDGLTFDGLFGDWVIANYLDNPALEDGRFGYADLDVQVTPVVRLWRAPLEWQDTVHQYAADYVEILPSGSQTVTVTFEGSLTVPLVAGLVHSGSHAWWSNRSDGSDTTLTRQVDLRNVTGATLKFWTWYDLEADWDYAYVEASTDGGNTWDILPGRQTTDTNPNGNSFGGAWTGQSKSDPSAEGPQWVEEQVDLSPYAGRQILLRFETITDDAVNNAGWLLDDITIPEIDFRDDVEAADGGWEAEGFIRSDNVLPQEWMVQVIELGEPIQVRSVPVGPDGRGEVTIGGLGRRLDRAVVVVSGLTPKTTEVGQYELTVQPAER